MHKACFNSSRIVVDGIYGNQDYTTIKKVFHISLLYFSTKEMQKPIYHGKTIVHEIDTQHPVDVKIANEGMVIFNTPNIFPEYFFISVPMFDDVINAEIDEWLYVMKHSDTKKDFKSPYMTKVAERLAVIKMSAAERNEYIHYQKQSVHSQDVLLAAIAKGKKEGLTEGKAEGETNKAIEIAKNLLRQNVKLSIISASTGLSPEAITALKDEL